jgi:hypothetical protein
LILLAQTLLFLLALTGVVAGAFGMLLYAGGALNPARPQAVRLRRAALAALCLCGIVASAALGFVGLPAILYFAGG